MTPAREPRPPEIAQPERSLEAERYAREAQRAAEDYFRARSLSMLRASLEHPSALPTLELFQGLAKPVQERLW